MSSVRVTEETKTFLTHLVDTGRATSLTDAAAYVCQRVRELEAMEKDPQGRQRSGAKRERVSVGGDERARLETLSESSLSTIWNGLMEMKHARPVAMPLERLMESLRSSLFPSEWGSLLLQIPEVPSGGQISRHDAALFLVNGWLNTRQVWGQRCVDELGALNGAFGKWALKDSAVEVFGAEFESLCPSLDNLFATLVTSGSRVEENTQKTLAFKRTMFVFLAAAIAKLRSKHNAECGRFLFRLWRTHGASNALNDCLAALGLSIYSKRGKEEEEKLITAVTNQIQHHTRRKGSCEVFFASCDNVDESFKSRVQQIGSRDLSLHFINSTLYRFRLPVPPGLGRISIRSDVLDVSVLFATSEMEYALAVLCEANVGRVLEPLMYGFVFGGKPFAVKGGAPRLVSLGVLEKTPTFPLPTQNYSESNLSEFMAYQKDFMARFPPQAKVFVASDALTFLVTKKGQRLHKLETMDPSDCDDSKLIPVPDWFHMSVCIFLGDCTRNNYGLMQQFCELIGGSYVINANVGKSMNDTMRVFNAFYPVAVARLFQYYLLNIASAAGPNPAKGELMQLVRRFWVWIVYTTRTIGANGQPVLEFQRHCRLVMTLAVYNVTWESSRTANHEALMHVMHWILPIVCQGPFSQYRSVVVDSLAFYHRASEAEQFLYKQSFTVNHTGTALGNTPTGQVQEYLNKKTKEAKRRDPTNSEKVGGETALLQHDRDVEERLGFLFPHLKDASEGVMQPPEPKVVIELMKRVHWTALRDPVPVGRDATNQKPLWGISHHEGIVRTVIRRVGRASQFGLDDEGEGDGGSGSEDESEPE